MKKNKAEGVEASETSVVDAPAPPAAYDRAEEETPAPTTIRVRGASAAPPIKTMENGQEQEKRYGYWRGQVPGDEVPDWARALGCEKNPGAFYWPADGQAEYELTIAQLEEVKADRYVVISYDATEEQMLRARMAPNEAAREAALRAAKLEAELEETKARMAMLTAQAAAAEAVKKAADAKARLAAEEARLRRG